MEVEEGMIGRDPCRPSTTSEGTSAGGIGRYYALCHYERLPIASACPSGVMNTPVMHDGTPVVEREDFFFLYPFMTTMAMVVGVGGGRGWVVATGRRWRL